MKKNVNPNHGISNSIFNEFDNNDDIIFINKSNSVNTSSNNNILITDPLHNKRLLMLPIISIVFLVTLISGISFAYYALSTNTVGASNVNTAMPSRVACNFNVTNSSFATTVTAEQFGQSNMGSTIFSNTINSNITLNGAAGCQCSYSVYLYENGGDRYVQPPGHSEIEFKYQISSTVNSASSPNSTSGSTSANFDLCANGSIAGGCRVGSGTIAVTTANTKVTHTYSLTTALYNTNYNQISLAGKTYKYRVGVEVMSCNFLNTNDYLTRQVSSSNVLGSTYAKTSIEEVYINNTKTVPSGVVYSWDVSEKQNGSVMAYLMNGSTSGRYKLYIGQDGGVRANPDSFNLFSNYTNLKSADLTNLITDDVKDMSNMFYSAGNNSTVTSFTLTGLDGWNTSKVTKMSSMFYSAGESATTWSIGDLSSWNVSNVINMNCMFRQAGYDATSFSLNLSSWNVSNVTDMNQMFYSAGKNATTWSIGNLNNWVVSKVTDMSYMFYQAGYKATTWTLGDLSGWNTSNVTDMSGMFYEAGYKATTWSIGDLSGWNVSKVAYMSNMFTYAGFNAATFSLNLSSWNVSNVTNMSYMFTYAGDKATSWSIGDLSGWNVSNVRNMSYMFSSAGESATTWNIGNLNNWNVSNVTDMSYMFHAAGNKATTWSIGDLSNWNVSSVTDMNWMFYAAGAKATTFSLNLSDWDVSRVTNMLDMFSRAGYNATTWSIGDISGWDVSNVTDMSYMFSNAGYNATTWSIGDLSNWNVSKVTTMSYMFNYAGYNASVSLGTLNVYSTNVSLMFYWSRNMSVRLKVHSNPTSYGNMFYGAATQSGASIIVDYSSTTTNIDNMIATKSSTSNVVKGSLIS